jgi:hypothetical protein
MSKGIKEMERRPRLVISFSSNGDNSCIQRREEGGRTASKEQERKGKELKGRKEQH